MPSSSTLSPGRVRVFRWISVRMSRACVCAGRACGERMVAVGRLEFIAHASALLIEAPPRFESGLAVGLCAAYVVDGAFDGRIASFQYLFSLGACVGYYFPSLRAQVVGISLVSRERLLEAFFLAAYVGAFVLPVSFVACDVE